MGFYSVATKEERDLVKNYIKTLEKVRISSFIKIDNKKYREVIFSNRFLDRITATVKGSLYIDENNKIVTEKDILRKLCRISYFAEIMFDDESNLSLKRLLKSHEDFKKEESDYDGIKLALYIIKKDSIVTEEEEIVLLNIIKSFYESRKKANEVVCKVVNDCDKLIKSNNNVVTEQIIDKLYGEYVEILLNNHTIVKSLKNGEKLFNDTLDKVKKFKRKAKIRINNKNKIAISKLEFGLYYYIKVINTYASIMNLNKAQYERQIKNVEKDNIDLRITSLRS